MVVRWPGVARACEQPYTSQGEQDTEIQPDDGSARSSISRQEQGMVDQELVLQDSLTGLQVELDRSVDIIKQYLDQVTINALGEDDRIDLDSVFMVDKLGEVVNSLSLGKADGLDKLPLVFYHNC
ncbi:hypothetical protein NDU88_008882 [Pleurodeles waltl]|uniref:Uncharacterized protein n=1 Tax=Pleurodeles waltl TaxID=8319 RepID=A0AAV7PQS4_PLEWA|nr:hypothetical protein NDU88_008882 [Pleurodeles waltl]